MERAVVVHEDRPENTEGLVLAVESILRHTNSTDIIVSHRFPDPVFRAWLKAQPVREAQLDTTGFSGWNIKARIIQQLLQQGYPEVIWIDADILVCGNFLEKFTDFSPSTVIATEETAFGQRQGGSHRTVSWGLKPGRRLARTINTGVLRVTCEHTELIDTWCNMLSHPVYRQSQRLRWFERPLHMVGDQEAFTALVCADEFAHIPVYQLRSGVEIAQCFGPAGFTPAERVKAWLRRRRPLFVHAMGTKPWARGPLEKVRGLRALYNYIHLETCPYTLIASIDYGSRRYPLDWTRPRHRVSRLFRRLSGDHYLFCQLPLALFDSATRLLRRVLGIGRYQANARFTLEAQDFRRSTVTTSTPGS
ncbi:hypothetical protein [Microbulbifer zhoushanensis]|uniref:hypothetical protein n=1 Tax=Microbulbifer TaxID=48073 RepID=UPI001F1F7D25|nr:hypothetical protein [Microbulbifer zhoushanensis]